MLGRLSRAVITLSLMLAASASAAHALGCPLINGLIDYNCDGKIKITFVGDSIVKGIGDSFDPVEGYPGRIQSEWPWAEIGNIGIPGITSGKLLQTLRKYLSRNRSSTISDALRGADIIALTVGVNDYWAKTDVGVTIGNLVSTVNYLNTKLANDDGVAPFIAVGMLLHSRRSFQEPFILAVNRLLTKYNSSSKFPVVIRFDKIDIYTRSLLRSDNLHPNGAGYDAMRQTVISALQGRIQQLMSKRRSDKDFDGIYDQVEPVFGTSPRKPDSDGDTLTDGDEVFLFGTDPTKRDTDGDGTDDNVAVATPTPSPTSTPTATPTP